MKKFFYWKFFYWFMMLISFFFIFLKSTRLVFFLFGLEVLFVSLFLFFLLEMKIFFFILFLFLGVLSSISSLMILKLLVISYGSDYVFF